MVVRRLINGATIVDKIAKNVANWQQNCRDVKFYVSTLVIIAFHGIDMVSAIASFKIYLIIRFAKLMPVFLEC